MFFIILIIIALVLFIVISIKIGNLKYKVTQTILKDTGLSTSNINTSMTTTLESKHLKNFLQENPEHTEDSIKELIQELAIKLVKKDITEEFSDFSESINKDKKLEKFKGLNLLRTNISYYSKSKLGTVAVFTDNRDEYTLAIYYSINNGNLKLTRYQHAGKMMLGL